jgi:hypothetical protein
VDAVSGAPAIVIRLALEERVRVLSSWEREGDERRLHDWLAHHPELAELVERALELAGKRPAA